MIMVFVQMFQEFIVSGDYEFIDTPKNWKFILCRQLGALYQTIGEHVVAYHHFTGEV